MKRYAEDLVHDLRERNLLPVALLLIAAIVAVPVFLLKPGSDSSGEVGAPPAVETAAATATVETLEVVEPKPSNLDSFKARDPFNRPGGGGRGSGGKDGDDGADRSGAPSGDAATPDSGGDGGEPGLGTAPAAPPDAEPVAAGVAYTLDLTFAGPRGERRFRDLGELHMLPSAATPLVVFQGVGKDGNAAVFLVDATVELLEGEGSCGDQPREACARLTLGAGAQQAFADERGRRYLIRVDQIRERRPPGAAAVDPDAPESGL